MPNRKNFLEVAKNLYNERFNNAKCGFVAGSLVKGIGTPNSDIDFYIVYDIQTLPKAYRETILYQDYVVECFVQNENSMNYFLSEEANRGECITSSMIIEGIVVPNDSEYSKKLKIKAQETYNKGPNALTEDKINSIRYSITDLLDDLPAKNMGELQGTLAVLHQKLGDFYFRANKKWSGSRKSLYRIMKESNPELAERYLNAFDSAYKQDFAPLMALADEILAPFGGRLMTGFKSEAPDKVNL